MSAIATARTDPRNNSKGHFVRVSNTRGDTIDFSTRTEKEALLLALSINTHAGNLTIVEDKKGG